MDGSGSILGNAVTCVEDPTLLTGQGKYVDDLRETGMLHVVFVRSPVAHGTVNSVDLGDAASMPGVVAVYSGDDLRLPTFQGFAMMSDTMNRPVFATERVRFVGDVIAAVVAETLQQATDAAQEIFADIDPLPVIIDPADGLEEDAPLLFPETGSNVCFASQFPVGGTDEDPCAGADAIGEVTMSSQRVAGVPMETHVDMPCTPQRVWAAIQEARGWSTLRLMSRNGDHVPHRDQRASDSRSESWN